MHVLKWLQLEVEPKLFLENETRKLITCCNTHMSEITAALGVPFFNALIAVIEHSSNNSLKEFKLSLGDILGKVDQERIPECVVQILTKHRRVFDLYESIKQPIAIRIGDEVFFNGKMVKAAENSLLVAIGEINEQLVSFNLETQSFEQSESLFPDLMDQGLHFAKAIIDSLKKTH